MGIKTPMITVIVPVYNVEKLLNRCIESILYQTHKDIELILVNDGSNDNSGVICDNYAKVDPRVKVIHQENSGVSNARNTGLQYALGNYVQFVDADDYLEPNMCQMILDNIRRNKSDLVICGFNAVFKKKISISQPMDLPRLKLETGYKEFIELYSRGLLNSPCNKLYKNDKTSKFLENLSLGEDLLFNLEYLKGTEVVTCIPDILYNYMDANMDSLTKKTRPDIIEITLFLHEKIHDFCQVKFDYDKDISNLYRFLIKDIFYAIQRIVFDSNDYKEHKLDLIERVLENKQVQKAALNVMFKSFQIKLFCSLLKLKNKYLIYYFYIIKKKSLKFFRRK